MAPVRFGSIRFWGPFWNRGSGFDRFQFLAKLGEPKRRSGYSSHPSDDVPKLINELRKKKELYNFVYRDRTFPANTWLQDYKTPEQEKVSRKFRHTKSHKMLPDAQHRPDWVLKRMCYIIRWIGTNASRAFDLDKFYSTLTARIFLGLLESKMSCRNECLVKHIDQKLSRDDRRNLRRAIRRLAEHSQSMCGYIEEQSGSRSHLHVRISWWKPLRIQKPRWLFLVISCTQIAQHLDFIAQRHRSRNICRAWWNKTCLIGYPVARSEGTARRNVSRMLGLNTNRCVHNIAECLTILFSRNACKVRIHRRNGLSC